MDSVGARDCVFELAAVLYHAVGAGAGAECALAPECRLVRGGAGRIDDLPGHLDNVKHGAVLPAPVPSYRGKFSDCAVLGYHLLRSVLCAGNCLAKENGTSPAHDAT